MYSNYTNKTGDYALWQVMYGYNSSNGLPYFYNITIDSSNCWNQPTIQTRFSVYYESLINGNGTAPFCWNGNSWQQVGLSSFASGLGGAITGTTSSKMFDGNYSTYAFGDNLNAPYWFRIISGTSMLGARLFEEALIWVQRFFPTGNINLANINGADTTSEWVLSCQATDGSFTTSYTNSSIFISVPVVNIISPASGVELELESLSNTFNVTTSISNDFLDSCWYNNFDSSGNPTSNVPFPCSNGTNSFILTAGFYGTHTIYVYANNTNGIVGQDFVSFTIQQPQRGGGGGNDQGENENKQLVPFFVREENFDFTCGVDADKDGLLCDPNEDWISCPEDCQFPSLDELLCFSGGHCVWREAWFLKLLFAMMLLITIYLVYTDLKLPNRRRKIFR